ncbi:MAG: bifunctional UDP-3-O-[3-hydroxymyristoyl] N-acetylglucosamine deacetylase/3-hydroxyacyl-ACP dehydratase [Saprospiraceae bacterium]|nr:bifunctional UDP-3-O-[3-hydroxymyristoyl] N-acetylglucosamine deacetylase/3-hydroxyacyl-ACP dehydratase [Saprospiraceae bacterium]
MKQHTIQSRQSIEGIGLHTGKAVTIHFNPAPAGHGIKFQRIDLDDQPIIPALITRVATTNRGTTIQTGEAQVSTIEHVLSAIQGMELDNILIEIDGPEVPILDGSASGFIETLQRCGKVEQEEERDFLEITETVSYQDEISGSELVAIPADSFQVTTLIDFNSPTLGQQYAAMEDISEYQSEIAPSRTFVFLHELEQLLNQNLIKGGNLDNAIVIADRIMNEEELAVLAKRLGKPGIKVEKTGVLNTTELKFKNEPARHKLLDVIGDLSLVGIPIKGKIVATKPGHTANVEFARILRKKYQEQRKLKEIPKYDPNEEPLLDSAKIQTMLPHRHPFLMVDKIIEQTDQYVVGVKAVGFNEFYFQGHFPNNPVFPGVLQMEALAQTGGILALSTVEDPHNWDTYFLKIDSCKFKRKVIPGDTLILKCEFLSPIRRGIVHMQGTVYVGNNIASEGELTAQIVRRKTDCE